MQQFSLLLVTVLLAGGVGLSALAAWLVQRTVETRTWLETQQAIVSHFDSLFSTAIFDQPAMTAADGHADHDNGATSAAYTSSSQPPPAFDAARFDRSVQFHLGIYEIIHARFYRPDGRIVYSYDPSEVGRPITDFLAADLVVRALNGGPMIEPGTHPAVDPRTGRPSAQTRALAVSITRDGKVIGAAWVQRDVTVLMQSIWQAQAIICAVILGFIALVYITLRHVYADSTRTIHDRTLALADAYGELHDTYDATLRALTAALDSRDQETGGHGQRVTRLAVRLGQELGLDTAALRALERGAMLHDIGKIGVPDAILRKPGPLTIDEWVLMRQHAATGAAMLDGISFLSDAVPLVRHHHERWDGAGYPDGLGGEAIPLGARIFAVADAFDAMTSRRPYRLPVSLAEARTELARCASSQFDPAVVAAHTRIPDAELRALIEAPASDDADQAA